MRLMSGAISAVLLIALAATPVIAQAVTAPGKPVTAQASASGTHNAKARSVTGASTKVKSKSASPKQPVAVSVGHTLTNTDGHGKLPAQ